MSRILGIHHVSITTPDLARIVRFYGELLGCPTVLDADLADNPAFDAVVGLQGSRAHARFLQAGNLFIEFWEYAEPEGRLPEADRPVNAAGITHLCFEVADARETHARLAAAGVPFLSEPQDLGTVITCYARDPDGNIVEIRQGAASPSPLELAPDIVAASRRNRGQA